MCIGGFFIWAGVYYHVKDVAAEVMQGDHTVQVRDGLTILFSTVPSDMGIIFYPGAKAEATAYLPLLEKLKSSGYACALVEMLLRMAIFDPNAADRVFAQVPEIQHWYIAGHSMGGAMANSYAAKLPGKAEELLLMDAYLYGDYLTNKRSPFMASLTQALKRTFTTPTTSSKSKAATTLRSATTAGKRATPTPPSPPTSSSASPSRRTPTLSPPKKPGCPDRHSGHTRGVFPMTVQEAIAARHSVRRYVKKPLPLQITQRLAEEIDGCNSDTGLHIQAVWNEPKAFGGLAAHYGKFEGAENYLALIGPKGPGLEEQAGYWGEHLVLLAQMLGLNTCWVAGTFSKGAVRSAITVEPGEKLACVIALGYGATQGVSHRSKPLETLCRCPKPMPGWFRSGMEAALLAPTAINQQRFRIALSGGGAEAKALLGPNSHIDLGIVKYHFEVGAGRGPEVWQAK